MFEIVKDKPSILKGNSTLVDDLDEEPHRISRVEEELWIVKDEVRGVQREQKHILAIMRNCGKVLHKIYGESREPIISLGDDDVDVGVGKEADNFMTSDTEQTNGVDESVKHVGNKEEEKVTGVNNEEMKEKI
ncbi:hypothetical protein TorRG33x02_315980 [Trema orientale]|uniref:Uncharacterized protein n=1 Tax=Trema orientale TaxID=63057 RepID=A0A2P5BM42_TREOI|nr:hypothetical protein TorRG33x02_315980 [Trema orientale]